MGIDINALSSPGVYAFVSSDGAVPAAIADHANAYMVGTATQGDDHTTTLVSSLTDFENVFGENSPSSAYVKAFFRVSPSGRLFFVKAATGVDDAEQRANFITAIETSFTEQMAQGFLLCPESAATFANQEDREAIILAMRDLAARERFQWIALGDCGETVVTVNELQTEFANVTSSLGHIAVYGTWANTIDGDKVPMSVYAAAVATKRFRQQGFYQPPAGPLYVLEGVQSLTVDFVDSEQDVLNATSNPHEAINIARNRPGRGIVLWGARVRSNDPAFKFINQRVIFNVLARTMVVALDSLLFQAVDGVGLVFQRIRQTAINICERFYVAGALFGPTSDQAYQVICDLSNNPALDLENGTVRLDVYAIPAPTMERIVVNLRRVPIGHFSLNLGGNN